MKEATGELSTTVIAIVAIAAVLAIFTTILLPYLRSSITSRMHCTDAVCDCQSGSKTCKCTYVDEKGASKNVTCNNPDYVKAN